MNEILLDCVVKPVVGVCVSMAAIAVIGVATEKVEAWRKNREEKKKPLPQVKGLLA